MEISGLRPARVVIVSASVGAGHDGAAAALTRSFVDTGYQVDRYDFLDLLPASLGRMLRGAYAAQLRHAPHSWEALLNAVDRHRVLARLSGATSMAAGQRRTRAAMRPGPGLVVSTYPLASQVLGRMRRRGDLSAPVVTYLTDLSVHALWVAAGVDHHIALHEVAARQARLLGATAVTVASPTVDPAFRPGSAADRVVARKAFGLPVDTPIALVVAGSWGVGDIERTAGEIAATGLAVPAVACGRNQALRERLQRAGSGVAVGWTEDMPTLIRAADVVVQNAGGLTSLEAMTARVPVVSYRCLPGHGTANAAALEQAGLAAWIRRREDLPGVLREVLHGPRRADQDAAVAGLLSAGGPTEQIIARLARSGTATTTRQARPLEVPSRT